MIWTGSSSAHTTWCTDILMPTCQCEQPKPYTRPSGARICLNDGCGGTIEDKAEKREKP